MAPCDWRPVESRGAGYEFAHSIVDDHSRLAYSELLGDERAQTVVGFVGRALDWFAGRGIVARRLMSDNAWTYTLSRSAARRTRFGLLTASAGVTGFGDETVIAR